jgi:hypothetical protein
MLLLLRYYLGVLRNGDLLGLFEMVHNWIRLKLEIGVFLWFGGLFGDGLQGRWGDVCYRD